MVVDSGRIQSHRPPHNNHSNNTLHTLVVEWSILRHRVCVRERIQRITPLFHATPLDTIPTTSRQFTNNITFTENTKRR